MGDWSVEMPSALGGGASCYPGGDSPGDASTPEIDYDNMDGCWDGIIGNDTSPSADDLFLLADDAEMGAASLSKIDETVPEPWEKLSEIAAGGKPSSPAVKVETPDTSKAVPFLVFSEPDESCASGQKRKAPSPAVKSESGDDAGDLEDPQMAALAARDPSTLSAEELKLLKKQKRLVRNRQSAQLSRQRKKSHMETLEIQVQDLERERRALVARVDLLTRENQYLRKQLGAQGRRPSSLPPPPPMPVPGRLGRGPMVMAVLMLAGMLCSQTDLMGPRLEPALMAPSQLYVGANSQQHEMSSALAASAPQSAPEGRAHHGRVLLSSDEGFRDSFSEQSSRSSSSSSASELSQQDVLIVTLLDHLASSHASPSLLPRLCARLQHMRVVSSCNLQHSIEEIRQRFLAEFWAFRQEFFSEPPSSSSSSSFSWTRSEQRGPLASSSALSPLYTQHQIASALPKPPTFPLAPVAQAPSDLASHFNFLCPSAQLLIADKPANPAVPASEDRSVPAVDNRTRVDEDGWRHEPIEEEHEQEQEEQQWKPTVLSDGYTVSMMLPRATLEGVGMGGVEMPEGGSRLVELRCTAFDLHPFNAPSLLAA
mmetsp:Transcript_19043/g.45771  ORF Transcript_19043/g.45771 Transcript_19043/m.45771 type:complete len:597 (+) Transcript_19043:110-1900(+)